MTSTHESTVIGPAKLGYVIMYVPDVEKTVAWYTKAFGLSVRRIDNSHSWAEMETGSTTLAFTPLEQHETAITGGVEHPAEQNPRGNIEINFIVPDIEAAFKHVLQLGAKAVTKPEEKPWGQKVAYIEDLNGNIIRLGSEVWQQ
jgi:catechol 2,3-dioxygenase-like lactoylglutathione lyase family enzyme